MEELRERSLTQPVDTEVLPEKVSEMQFYRI